MHKSVSVTARHHALSDHEHATDELVTTTSQGSLPLIGSDALKVGETGAGGFEVSRLSAGRMHRLLVRLNEVRWGGL